jgi:hypothetical protein
LFDGLESVPQGDVLALSGSIGGQWIEYLCSFNHQPDLRKLGMIMNISRIAAMHCTRDGAGL